MEVAGSSPVSPAIYDATALLQENEKFSQQKGLVYVAVSLASLSVKLDSRAPRNSRLIGGACQATYIPGRFCSLAGSGKIRISRTAVRPLENLVIKILILEVVTGVKV